MRSKTAVFLSAVSLLSSLLTREAAAEPESKRLLYLLEDAKHEQWCAFSKESAWKTEVNSLSATTVATVEYLNGRISTIKVAKESEAGDWIGYDHYFLDQSEAIRKLNRTINSLPGDN